MPNNKKIYGIIGYPLKHTLSPSMHNAAFRALNIDAEYKVFEKKPEELNDFLDNLDKENVYGLNVTIPYKEKVLDFITLDKESYFLKTVKAVNTVVKKDNQWLGFNTDIPGFARHLKEQLEPKDKKVALLGAGGASRAVCYVLANSGAKEIVVFDIDKQKTDSVVEMVKSLFKDFNISAVNNVEALDIKSKDLLINATPIGLKDTDPLLVKEEMLHKNLFVYDLIYNPAETKLLKLAKEIGAKTSNGLGMLLYQGVLAFEIWTGQRAPKEIMKRALLESLCR